jgi:hypothetical protein
VQSPACRDALAALQAHESARAAASAPKARPDERPDATADRTWRILRARAAKICLGGEPDAPAPLPHSATAPITVPPAVIAPPVVRAPRVTTPSPPPVETRKPPTVVMSCDAGGCWTSDGARLPQVGRNPQDARVRCSVQGSFVVCW